MKKKILMVIVLMLSICLFSARAEEKLKSVEYDMIVSDSAGVELVGRYTDNNVKKEITVTIPQNEKVRILSEYMKNDTLYGHVKYKTTITVKQEAISRESTNVRPDPMPNTSNNNSYDDSTNTSETSDSQDIINQDTSGTTEKKYIELEKTIEVEGDINLSKCRVDKEYALDSAINLNETRKIKIVNKDGISLYNGPALGYGKLSSVVPANTELEYSYGAVNLTQDNKEVAWAYVESDSIKGWLYKGLLDSGVADYTKGRILSFSKVDIKEFPYDDSKTVGTLPKDLRKSFNYLYGVQDLNNDQWYYISYKGTRGWVKKVAIGVNAQIKITKNTNLYKNPSTGIVVDGVTIASGTKLTSIYRYYKKDNAFYVEYEGKKGWIILDSENPNFEVKYLEDEVKDKLLDKDEMDVATEEKKSGFNIVYILIAVVIIIIITVIVIVIAKKKRNNSNNFSVSAGDISTSEVKPQVTLINRNRMGR